MDKVKKNPSLKKSFFIYLAVCFAAAFSGAMIIGFATNALQVWYSELHDDVELEYPIDIMLKIIFGSEITLENTCDEYGYERYVYIVGNDGMIFDPYYDKPMAEKKYILLYFIISYAQFLLMPLWMALCISFTGMHFYRRELKKPIEILLDASHKISENQLDFSVSYDKPNELGQLCTAFDDMRRALDENNREMWRSLEERKRLNSAFSHDLRTPLTVLKGYNDFLEKYSGKLTQEKSAEILGKMRNQINRLESYTYKMSAVHKLEDITPDAAEIKPEKLREMLGESGKYICGDTDFELDFRCGGESFFADAELISEVYENLVSNAQRYAKSRVRADAFTDGDYLIISVSDDGAGFSEKALKLAAEPFYRDDREQNGMHFGLGLYICRIICEKCGGDIFISNSDIGGTVTAKFLRKSR